MDQRTRDGQNDQISKPRAKVQFVRSARPRLALGRAAELLHRGGAPLSALVKSEIARWTPIIKEAGPLN